MRALTLTQPWATLVALGAKTIETRGWPTKYRGPLAMHAAKGWTAEDREVCHTEPFLSVLRAWKDTLPNAGMLSIISALPHGVIVAVGELGTCYQFDERTPKRLREGVLAGRWPEHEASFGNFEPGRYGFRLDDMRALAEPVPARGMQGLWPVPRDVESAIAAQLRRAA